MIEFNKKVINKKYVHKSKNENVLVCNLRRAIPIKIEKSVFENIVLSNVNKNEIELILNNYILHQDNLSEGKKSYFIMHNIPYFIKNTHFEILKDQLDLLPQYYDKDKENNYYILKEEITEIEELSILKILNLQNQKIDYNKRKIISDIFEKIQDFRKDDIFFANMLANGNHPFFFEHPVDHVPGMMIIEASRQFLIAISHLYGKIPLKGINFILSSIHVDFFNYLELNQPIIMIAQVNKVKRNKDGSWRNGIDLNVYFYQNNIKCTLINYIGRVINNDHLKTLSKRYNYVKNAKINLLNKINSFD